MAEADGNGTRRLARWPGDTRGHQRLAWLAWVRHNGGFGLGLACLLTPWGLSDPVLAGLFSQWGIAFIAMSAAHALLRLGGVLSLGQGFFAGWGAYTVVGALRTWPEAGVGLVVLAPTLAGLLCMVLAWPLGWVLCRRSGMMFAMLSIALVEAMAQLAHALPVWFGGEVGWGIDRVAAQPWLGWRAVNTLEMAQLVGAYVAAAAWVWGVLQRSPLVLSLQLARDDPQRLALAGCSPTRIRTLGWMWAALAAGVAGGLAALDQERVGPDVFSVDKSVWWALMVVMGARQAWWGALWVAALWVAASVWLARWTSVWALVLGVVFLATLLLPGGWRAVLARRRAAAPPVEPNPPKAL